MRRIEANQTATVTSLVISPGTISMGSALLLSRRAYAGSIRSTPVRYTRSTP